MWPVSWALTTLTDADIVVGEGRQIVFVDPAAVPLLDTSESCTHFVTAFLASPEHADLVAVDAERQPHERPALADELLQPGVGRVHHVEHRRRTAPERRLCHRGGCSGLTAVRWMRWCQSGCPAGCALGVYAAWWLPRTRSSWSQYCCVVAATWPRMTRRTALPAGRVAVSDVVTVMAVPVVIFFLIVQRKVTAGLTAGAVKG